MVKNPEVKGPQFEHDCDSCLFLGRGVYDRDEKKISVDMYVCPGTFCTFIARCSSDGPDYFSRDVSWITKSFVTKDASHSEIWELAIKRCKERAPEVYEKVELFIEHHTLLKLMEKKEQRIQNKMKNLVAAIKEETDEAKKAVLDTALGNLLDADTTLFSAKCFIENDLSPF